MESGKHLSSGPIGVSRSMPDPMKVVVQEVVVKGAAVKLNGELLRYRLENEDDMEVRRSMRRHFCRAAEKVIDDVFYNARISAVCQYYKRIKEHESGVPPSFMDVFVRGHRGPDPTNPEVLCTEAAREKMMAYGEEMTQRHGPDFDWRQAEVCLWHGVVDYDQSISRASRSGSSSGSSRSSWTTRDTQAQEEAHAAREEARQATQTVERLTNMTAYMASYLQDIIARLGLDVNLPPFWPPQMSPQQGGCHHPRARNHLRGGRWHHRAPSHL
ncbi:hypothetical protein U9M48_004446 [Paspalum notatum var. saurae]|uniref:Uncharacterized protein n=1 Tax=Paspalum notatum var. saurae TaxID=547442 RepID=A0AAQ3PTA9_PASNO